MPESGTEFVPNVPKFGPSSTDFDQTRPRIHQVLPVSANFGTISTKCGQLGAGSQISPTVFPESTTFAQASAETGPQLTKLVPNSAKFDRTWPGPVGLDQHFPEIVQIWPDVGQTWLARTRPNSTEIGPARSDSTRIGPRSSGSGFDRTRRGLCQLRPTLVRPSCARHRPDFARKHPDRTRLGWARATLGPELDQLQPEFGRIWPPGVAERYLCRNVDCARSGMSSAMFGRCI